MKGYCSQCSMKNFHEDLRDFAEVTKQKDTEHGRLVSVNCCGCGACKVDHNGVRIDKSIHERGDAGVERFRRSRRLTDVLAFLMVGGFEIDNIDENTGTIEATVESGVVRTLEQHEMFAYVRTHFSYWAFHD
jgi:hypothetical protein